MIVLLTEPLTADDVVKVSIDKSGQRSEVTTVKRNPYTLQFTVPGTILPSTSVPIKDKLSF